MKDEGGLEEAAHYFQELHGAPGQDARCFCFASVMRTPGAKRKAGSWHVFVDSHWRGLGFNDWINEAGTLERGEAFDPDTNNRRPYLPEMFFSQLSAVPVKFLLADNLEVNIGFG